MAQFYLDENMPVQLVAELQAFGHVGVSARSLHRLRLGDDDHLLFAAQHGWTLVTRDYDYRLLQSAWLRWAAAWGAQAQHAGILITPHTWLAPQAALQIHVFMQAGRVLINQLYEWRRDQWVQR